MSNKEKKIGWKIDAYYIDSCNCDWGCPCQFLAKPTHGKCEGMGGIQIKKGNYGSTLLDGLGAAFVVSYPGAVHEGHGKASHYIDDRATHDQFQALSKILTGVAGGGPFEIYASTCESFQEPRKARIKIDINGLKSHVHITDVGEVQFEPIRNPVTNQIYRAIIELPTGFEASRMEQASSKKLVVDDGYLNFTYSDTYGSLSDVSWSGP
ncbi:MAG: DUF1326 domain-containing protein [Thaumarchaeota archaeon]|nr:DUF1326 domain-containing protein [Nitrososphaerota archaeon]